MCFSVERLINYIARGFCPSPVSRTKRVREDEEARRKKNEMKWNKTKQKPQTDSIYYYNITHVSGTENEICLASLTTTMFSDVCNFKRVFMIVRPKYTAVKITRRVYIYIFHDFITVK